VKGQTETGGGEFGTVTLGASDVGSGVFNSGLPGMHLAEDEQDDSGRASSPAHRPFSRKIGLRYSIQVLVNSLPLLIADFMALTAAIVVCRTVFIYFDWLIWLDLSAYLVPIASGFLLLNIEFGLYPGVRLSPVEELRRLVVSATCMFIVWAMSVAMIRGDLARNVGFLISVYLVCLLTLPICRGWARSVLGRWTNWGLRAIVCGNDPSAVQLFHWLRDNRQLGLRPVGVVADRDVLEVSGDDDWYAGSWEQLPDIASKRGVFWAIVVPPDNKAATMSSILADYLYTIPHVHVVSELTGLPDVWNPQRLDGLAGVHLQQNLMLPLPRLTKRLFDLLAAVIGGVILLPFFYLPVAFLVKMSSRGPLLYSQERIGRYGRRFHAWKFRTMFQDANLVLDRYLEENPDLKEEWERDHKLRYDPRTTRIGRFLRKTSLDELPQLWNVIRGDMSLVGPRPIVTKEIEKYGPYFGLYTMVKPGITGLWQVSGRNNTTYDERVQFDAYYVRNWSFWLDAFLLLKTIRIVLFARGAY
jgi:Undecaprenyl-phosphate galactose phosphotransferase WbaP